MKSRIGNSVKKKIGPVFLLVALFLLIGGMNPLRAAATVHSTLIPDYEAQAVGLTRPWFAQISMDIGADRITHVTICDDQLFVTTDAGRLTVIDGKTGATVWSRILGDPKFETLAPAGNSRIVAAVHGLTIHLFDRQNGKLLLTIPMEAPAASGPQLSERFLMIPTLTQKMYAYPLREKLDDLSRDRPVKQYQLQPILPGDANVCPSLGLTLVQPVLGTETLSEDRLIWAGYASGVMIAQINTAESENAIHLLYRVSLSPEIMYIKPDHNKKIRLDYRNEIDDMPYFIPKDPCEIEKKKRERGEREARRKREGTEEEGEEREDTASGGMILIGTDTGFVIAVNDWSGDIDWTFGCGIPVKNPVGANEQYAFVSTHEGVFIALNLKDGKEVWRTTGIGRFVSVSPTRLYVVDQRENLLVLNPSNGERLGSLPLPHGTWPMFNPESDRIYLIAADGLIQALRESQLDEPVRNRETSAEIAARLKDQYDMATLGRLTTAQQEAPGATPAPQSTPTATPSVSPTPPVTPARSVAPGANPTEGGSSGGAASTPKEDDDNPFR